MKLDNKRGKQNLIMCIAMSFKGLGHLWSSEARCLSIYLCRSLSGEIKARSALPYSLFLTQH